MDLLVYPNPTAQFYALISTAQSQAAVHLATDLESYLVFLLMRFSSRPEIVHQILGLRFLEALETLRHHPYFLREVADSCLLFAGLFPEHAQKRHVTVRYFIQIGQSAYAHVAQYSPAAEAPLYEGLSTDFVKMTGVLQATRKQVLQPTIEAWLYSLTQTPTAH